MIRRATIGHQALMSNDLADRPDPKTDPDPERAPGGVDADLSESDVGAASGADPVIPDPPLSAQTDEADVPDAVQERETPDTTDEDDEGASEPSA